MQNYQSKAAIKSLGVVAPLLAMLVIGMNMFGIDISADVVGVADTIAGTIDNGAAIIGIGLGIWGRIRATAEITGVFKAKDA